MAARLIEKVRSDGGLRSDLSLSLRPAPGACLVRGGVATWRRTSATARPRLDGAGAHACGKRGVKDSPARRGRSEHGSCGQRRRVPSAVRGRCFHVRRLFWAAAVMQAQLGRTAKALRRVLVRLRSVSSNRLGYPARRWPVAAAAAGGVFARRGRRSGAFEVPAQEDQPHSG